MHSYNCHKTKTHCNPNGKLYNFISEVIQKYTEDDHDDVGLQMYLLLYVYKTYNDNYVIKNDRFPYKPFVAIRLYVWCAIFNSDKCDFLYSSIMSIFSEMCKTAKN